jgi:hypothetical protein
MFVAPSIGSAGYTTELRLTLQDAIRRTTDICSGLRRQPLRSASGSCLGQQSGERPLDLGRL